MGGLMKILGKLFGTVAKGGSKLAKNAGKISKLTTKSSKKFKLKELFSKKKLGQFLKTKAKAGFTSLVKGAKKAASVSGKALAKTVKAEVSKAVPDLSGIKQGFDKFKTGFYTTKYGISDTKYNSILKKQENIIKNYTKSKEASTKRLSEIISEIQKLTDQLFELQNIRSQLLPNDAELQKRLLEYDESIANLNKTIEEEKSNLQNISSQINDEDNQKLKDKSIKTLMDLETKLSDTKKERSEYLVSASSNSEELKSIDAQISDVENKIHQLELEKDKINSDIQYLDAVKEDQKSMLEIELLKAQQDEMNKTNQAATEAARLAEMNSELSKANDEAAKARSEVDAKSRAEAEQRQLNALNSSTSGLRDQISKMNQSEPPPDEKPADVEKEAPKEKPTDFISDLVEGAVGTILGIRTIIIMGLAALLKPLWEPICKWVIPYIKMAWDWLCKVISPYMEYIMAGLRMAWTFLKGLPGLIIGDIVGAITTAITVVKSYIEFVVNQIVNVFNMIKDLPNAIGALGSYIWTKLQYVYSIIMGPLCYVLGKVTFGDTSAHYYAESERYDRLKNRAAAATLSDIMQKEAPVFYQAATGFVGEFKTLFSVAGKAISDFFTDRVSARAQLISDIWESRKPPAESEPPKGTDPNSSPKTPGEVTPITTESPKTTDEAKTKTEAPAAEPTKATVDNTSNTPVTPESGPPKPIPESKPADDSAKLPDVSSRSEAVSANVVATTETTSTSSKEMPSWDQIEAWKNDPNPEKYAKRVEYWSKKRKEYEALETSRGNPIDAAAVAVTATPGLPPVSQIPKAVPSEEYQAMRLRESAQLTEEENRKRHSDLVGKIDGVNTAIHSDKQKEVINTTTIDRQEYNSDDVMNRYR